PKGLVASYDAGLTRQQRRQSACDGSRRPESAFGAACSIRRTPRLLTELAAEPTESCVDRQSEDRLPRAVAIVDCRRWTRRTPCLSWLAGSSPASGPRLRRLARGEAGAVWNVPLRSSLGVPRSVRSIATSSPGEGP